MTRSKTPSAKAWKTADGVFPKGCDVFCFSQQERAILTAHLKNIPDKTGVENFIVGANDAIAEWMVSYSTQPTKAKKGDVEKLDKLHDRLKAAISAIKLLDSVSDIFWLRVTERVIYSGTKHSGAVGQEECRQEESRAVKLLDDLADLAAQLKSELSKAKGLANDRKLALVKAMISSYLISIQRTPSSTRNGIFMSVMGDIVTMLGERKIKITIGEKVIKTALNEMASTIDQFNEYR